MRFLHIAILVCFLCAVGSSQTIDELQKSIEQAEENSEYDEINSLRRQLQKKYAEQENWGAHAEQYLYIGQNYFFNYEDFKQLKNYSDSALAFVKAHHVKLDQPIYPLIWNHYGYYYDYVGDRENAILAFEKDLEISIHLADNDENYDRIELGKAYQNLGSQYSSQGDYDKAMNYYQKAIVEYDEDSYNLANAYNNIAFDFLRKGEPIVAKAYYQKALVILEELPVDTDVIDSKLRIFKSLVSLSNEQTRYDSAYFYLEKVRSLIRPNEEIERAWYYQVLGGTNLFTNQMQKAEYNLLKAVDLYQKNLPPKHPNLSSCYKETGEFYAEIGKHQKALQFYQKSLVALPSDFNDSINFTNPSLSNRIDDKIALLQILYYKAKSLSKIEQLSSAKSTLHLAIQLIDQIRYNYLADGSKYALLERAMPIYEQAIDLAIEMGELEWAFEIAERSKATLLLESIKNSAAQAFAGIPSELLEEEREMKVQIAFYERLLNEAESEADQTEYQRTLFDLRQNYQAFLERLENDYPSYYELKYEVTYPSIAELQNALLDEQTALLEYFTGDSSIYLFVLTKNDLQVQTFQKTSEFEENLQQLRTTLNHVETNGFSNFTSSAYYIYQNYLQPILQQLPSAVNQLLLIPDGELSYIPFQAFIQYPIDQQHITDPRFDTLSYLVQDYAISYAYSSTLLHNNQATPQHSNTNFGGFAPIFSGGKNIATRSSRDDLSELPFSQIEIENISDLVKGKYFLKDNASLQNFRDQAADFNILHLSTHAIVDDQNPSQSRIYFFDDYLTVNEIYNLPIHADLTVLSACETGVGEYKRGEGMLSLARAFRYAGCPSLVTSLWQVNDEKTAHLMIDFYEQLLEKASKNQALQQAQVNYLKAAPMEAAHPFYWAAFVQTGNADPLISNWSYTNWLIGLGVGIVIVLGFRFWNIKK